MKIPYGVSDFARIRTDGYFYADKTMFLPALEAVSLYPVFLRPRRLGKSLLVRMMEHYYDVGRKDRFDELFQGLWVHEHPTPERNKYLVLVLDFSAVATDKGEEGLRRTFLAVVRNAVSSFLIRYGERVPRLAPLSEHLYHFQDAESLVGAVFQITAATANPVYLFIDEYDHFANRLLAERQEALYEAIVKKTGFVRTFYAALKSATATGAISRLFVTGVSPIMLDDLSSGFNIATQASRSRHLAHAAGFTRAEVEGALTQFLAARPELSAVIPDQDALFAVLEQHYNGYRFSDLVAARVFNSDMVLYFLQCLDDRGQFPDQMLDMNVRTEYSHLQRIGLLAGASPQERLSILREILQNGHIRSVLAERFGIRSLPQRTSFISLLYYLGMLTLGAAPQDVVGFQLEIPNRVIRELQWEHLALTLEDEWNISFSLDDLRVALQQMAADGDIGLFLELFHKEVLQKASVRDLRGLDEKTIKLLLMTYVSLGRVYYPLSEKELAQGFCDMFLGVNMQFAGAKYAWLLEFKYLKTGAKPAEIEAAFAEAEAQVARYRSDATLLPLLVTNRGTKSDLDYRAGMLVFVGAKKVLFRPHGEGITREVAVAPVARAAKGKAPPRKNKPSPRKNKPSPRKRS